MTVNIALRRQLWQLDYYSEGSIPDALIECCNTEDPDQIKQFQDYSDTEFAGDLAKRRRAKFVPGDIAAKVVQTKEPEQKNDFDEWLARIICYAFSVPPQWAVKLPRSTMRDFQIRIDRKTYAHPSRHRPPLCRHTTTDSIAAPSRSRDACAVTLKEGCAMDDMKIFVPITKIDAAQRLVYGVVTAEKPDVTGEVCDYASTKPLYQKWSQNFASATDGKSLGNLRAMHGHVAAGKLVEIAFNDEAKQIEICGKVVDDAEWQKVEEGVYTGFSQGGRYLKRWPDPDEPALMRYTAEPVEVSLVDHPCLPEATFAVIKADGSTELRKFKVDTAAERAALGKIGARHSKADKERIKQDPRSSRRARSRIAAPARIPGAHVDPSRSFRRRPASTAT